MDEMVKAYEKFMNDNEGKVTMLQIFQAGWSGAAVSMRDRAIKAIQGTASLKDDDKNQLLTTIGSLPDIAA